MSWLLILTTPVLLMLTAAGLGRIEASLEAGSDEYPADGSESALPVNPQFRPSGRDNPV